MVAEHHRTDHTTDDPRPFTVSEDPMAQSQLIEEQDVSVQDTGAMKSSDQPFEGKDEVSYQAPEEGTVERGRRRKPLKFYGAFTSIVIMILMVSLDSSELGVALTVGLSHTFAPFLGRC